MELRTRTRTAGEAGATCHSALLAVVVAGSILSNFVIGQHGPPLLPDEAPGFSARRPRSPRAAPLFARDDAAELLLQLDLDELRARADFVTPAAFDAAIALRGDQVVVELWSKPTAVEPRGSLQATETHAAASVRRIFVGGDVRALEGLLAGSLTIVAQGDVVIAGELRRELSVLTRAPTVDDLAALVVLAKGSIRAAPHDAAPPPIEATLLAIDGTVDVPTAAATPEAAVDAALATLLGMRD